MPAEWEPHEATWLAWPHEKSDWPGKFEPIPWLYGEIVRHLALYYIPCVILLNGGSVVALQFYKIDRATHERNVATLREAAALAEEAHLAGGASTPERAA